MQDRPNGEVVEAHVVEEHVAEDVVVVDVVGPIKGLQSHLVRVMPPCCHRNNSNGLDK